MRAVPFSHTHIHSNMHLKHTNGCTIGSTRVAAVARVGVVNAVAGIGTALGGWFGE